MSPTPEDCFHLSVDIVRQIHTEALQSFGGATGIRDENLLASAVLTPQSSFGGKSPYADIAEIAAAYLFYLCRNHPFIDGNKRTALAACLVFLEANRLLPSAKLPVDEWESFVLDIAASQLDRDQTTRRLRQLLKKLPRKKK